MKVVLLNYTKDAEKMVACAAKLCYANSNIDTLMDGLTEEKTSDFIDFLTEIGHESPIEHASFSFGIEGVSRSLLAQITRHRIASFNVQSQRYVRKGNFEFITPPEIENDKQAKQAFLKAMQAAQQHYDNLVNLLTVSHTKKLIQDGLDEKEAIKTAEKLANEDARFVLPNACDTKMIMTLNARSLHNFFNHRCCNRAQWEIRQLAELMYIEVIKIAPKLFKNAGPKCLNGPCPEGKMTCKSANDVKSHYKKIYEEYGVQR